MINTVDFKPNEEYFAAANSYRGFVSNFPREFSPEKYERVFILKGGPGTGKSTLMRGIGALFSNEEAYVKAIYCSSDIHSLDGVTITKDNKSICIIDGTAPHSVDPQYPGVKEEIIDLARCLDTTVLQKHKTDVFSLNKTKKEHFQSAYSLLEIAGAINDKILANYSKSYDYSRAEFIINELLTDKKTNVGGRVDWQFISCYNKDARVRLPLKNFPLRSMKISGNGYSEYLFIGQLLSHIGIENTTRIYRTPLSDKLIECIKTSEFAVIADNASSDALDTASLAEPTGESVRLFEYKKEIEKLAAESFAKASVAHFELEKIYKEAADFSHNEDILKQLYNQISLYFK